MVNESIETSKEAPKKSVALSGVVAGNTALCTVGRTGNDLHYRGYRASGDGGARQRVEPRLQRVAIGQGAQRRTYAQPAGIAGLRGEDGLQCRDQRWRLDDDIDRRLHPRLDVLSVDHAPDEFGHEIGHAADRAGTAGRDRARDIGFVTDG